MNFITFTKINTMKKNGLKRKDTNKFDYKNWDLLMVISTSLRKETNSRLVKNLIKKNYLKNNKRWFEKLNNWINQRETDINRELSEKHFNFQKTSDMLKTVYNENYRKRMI